VSSKIKEFSSIFGDLLIANMKETSTYAEIKNYASTMEMQLYTSKYYWKNKTKKERHNL
jgi:hypothetical protein